MEVTLNQAVESARSLSNQYKAVLRVVGVLEDIVNLEARQKEVKTALKLSSDELSKLRDQIFDALAKLTKIKEQKEDLESWAKKIEDDAVTQSNSLIKQAKSDADIVTKEALLQYDLTKKNNKKVIEDHEKVMETYAKQKLEAFERVEDIKRELADLKERFK